MGENGQEISLIRFVDKLDYLKDDLLNGFRLSRHSITFESTIIENLKSMFDIWSERGISNDAIRKLRLLRDISKNDFDFSFKLAQEIDKDKSFKWNVIHLVGSVTFEVPMKCFTEVRHNQKLHRYHVGFFGKYGIQLTEEWAIKNKATPVIYVKRNSEMSKRLGVIVSILNTLGRKFTMNALFNFLSLIEVGSNALEFEWRIVGDHELFVSSKGTMPTVPFNLDDVLGLYVGDEEDRANLQEFIDKNINDGFLVGKVPNIYLTNDILLSDEEIQLIEDIRKRD